jgi:BioD-like phosphotransacetylase family protein
MPALVFASLDAGEGRTTVSAALGARIAAAGRSVRLARVRAGAGADVAAEDDARTLGRVPGCTAAASAVTEQDALDLARSAAEALVLLEAPPGDASSLAALLDGKVVLVTSRADELAAGEIAAAAGALGERVAGVVALRQPERCLDAVRESFEGLGLRVWGVVPEDALLAGPTVRELSEALHASYLAGDGDEHEAVEHVMLGPISADPGQPYFLQHGSKAVINRADKMDLHLAALATEPDCLVLTSGRVPSPYLLDRVVNSGAGTAVLHAPETTVQAMEALDELFTKTRFSGTRKVERAAELFARFVELPV